MKLKLLLTSLLLILGLSQAAAAIQEPEKPIKEEATGQREPEATKEAPSDAAKEKAQDPQSVETRRPMHRSDKKVQPQKKRGENLPVPTWNAATGAPDQTLNARQGPVVPPELVAPKAPGVPIDLADLTIPVDPKTREEDKRSPLNHIW